MMGYLKDAYGTYTPGLLAIGIGPIISAAIVLAMRRPSVMPSGVAAVGAD